MENQRRNFLLTAASLSAAGLAPELLAARSADRPSEAKEKESAEEAVSAPEDLMREHGVLNRILLIYEEGLRRLRAREEISPDVFRKPALLVRTFVEEYHEKLEENFIFPHFEKQKKLVDLVKVLRRQHEAGRAVTAIVLHHATGEHFHKADSRQEIVQACEAFIRMYRPHEAREDTVLFPALRKIMPAKQLAELGEQFEREEDRLFGAEGFEKTVDQVGVIEKHLGIFELDQFTPRLAGR